MTPCPPRLLYVPFVNRPFESEIHGTVNFTYFCYVLLVTWCNRVMHRPLRGQGSPSPQDGVPGPWRLVPPCRPFKSHRPLLRQDSVLLSCYLRPK